MIRIWACKQMTRQQEKETKELGLHNKSDLSKMSEIKIVKMCFSSTTGWRITQGGATPSSQNVTQTTKPQSQIQKNTRRMKIIHDVVLYVHCVNVLITTSGR